MEAATPPRELSGDKAQRIIDAMRSSVGLRGAAGSTFDHVAREAGVSRGLLHYYFGTKERLIVEVVRRDCDIRMEILDLAIEQAADADALLDAMVRSLEDMLEHDPGFIALIFELFASSRRNEEIKTELGELMRRTREHVAEQLELKAAEGAITLAAPAETIATIVFSLADGLALRMLSEPEFDHRPAIEAGTAAVRHLFK